MLSKYHSALQNRDTKLPPCQLLPVGISRVSMLGAFLRKIRCCPKHCTMFVAVFVAVKHTTSTRAFLCTQLSQQNSIYRGTYAYATPCGCLLKILPAFMSPMFPFCMRQTALAYARHVGRKESRSFRLLSDMSPTLLLVVCDLCVVVWTSNM